MKMRFGEREDKRVAVFRRDQPISGRSLYLLNSREALLIGLPLSCAAAELDFCALNAFAITQIADEGEEAIFIAEDIGSEASAHHPGLAHRTMPIRPVHRARTHDRVAEAILHRLREIDRAAEHMIG